MTEDVRRAFDETGTIIDFIISGYTSKLQPLDVGINKPFKFHLRKCFEQFMVRNNGNIPHWMEVATWVEYAWCRITVQSITNTWRHIGIGSVQQDDTNSYNGNDVNNNIEIGAMNFLEEEAVYDSDAPTDISEDEQSEAEEEEIDLTMLASIMSRMRSFCVKN